MRTFGTKGKIRMGAMIGLVAAGLAPGSSGLAGDAAWAGEYVFDRLITNGATHDSTENPTDQAWSPGQLGSASVSPPYGGGGSFSIRAKSAGSVAAVFKWQPSYDGDVPEPDSVLWVKATSVAYLGANANAAMTLHDLQVSNGYGDAKQPYAEMTETSKYWWSNGTRLVRKATNGQQEVTLDAVTLTAGGRLGGSDSGWIGAYLSYSVEKVTRGLTLHRDGAIGERTEGDTTYGDTTYSYFKDIVHGTSTIPVHEPNWQAFRPVFEGDWATGQVVDGPGGNAVLCEEDVTPWHWSPAGGLLDGDRWNYHRQLMDDGNPHLHINDSWVGTATGPKTITVTYTATVKDKYVAGSGSAPAAIGTATAKYVLTLHDECEKAGEEVFNVDAPPKPLWGSGGAQDLVARADGPIVGPEQQSSHLVTSGSGKAREWAIGGGIDISALKVSNLLELGVNLSGQYGETVTVDASQEKNLTFDVPADYYTYAEIVIGFVRKIVYFKHFWPAGEHTLGIGPPGNDLLHKAWKDTRANAKLQWHDPPLRTDTDPYPTYNPADPPALPGDPDSGSPQSGD